MCVWFLVGLGCIGGCKVHNKARCARLLMRPFQQHTHSTRHPTPSPPKPNPPSTHAHTKTQDQLLDLGKIKAWLSSKGDEAWEWSGAAGSLLEVRGGGI